MHSRASGLFLAIRTCWCKQQLLHWFILLSERWAIPVYDLVGLKDMGSKMYILIGTLLPCLSEQTRLQAAWLIEGRNLCAVYSSATETLQNINWKYGIDSQRMQMRNGAWCWHPSGCDSCVFKSYHSLLGMWQQQPNARECGLNVCCLFLHKLWEFMGWSKWQWYGVCSCPITACFD